MALKRLERRFTDPKGNVSIITNENISEVYVSPNGYFDSVPTIEHVGIQPFMLPSSSRKELIDEAYRLWKFDAIGSNVVETTSNFVMGRGLVYQFDDEKVQFHADKFYRKNRLDERIRQACDESTVYGEVFMWLRPIMTEVTAGSRVLWRVGDTKVTFISPRNITNMQIEDDGDPGDVLSYIYEWQDGKMMDHTVEIQDITKVDYDNPGNGCIVHLKLNAGTSDPFGHSDLIPVKEWMDNYQEYLRDGVIINKLYRSPAYDISIDGGSPEEVQAAVSRYRSFKIGSNPVHSAREEWKVLEFHGPNGSNEQARRALLLIIAAGVCFPEFMLADGSNANLASSKSQQMPVVKKFEFRQDLWAMKMRQVLQFALIIKAIHGSGDLPITKDAEGDIEHFSGVIEFPAIAKDRDLEVAQTNAIAIEGGYMSKATAASRLCLDYSRESEMALEDLDKEIETTKKKIDAGIMPDPKEKEKIAGMNSDGPDTRQRDRTKDKGGANETVRT